MDWKNQLSKTPYLVLFIALISIGVGTASALVTITLAGDVVITENLTVNKDVSIGDDLVVTGHTSTNGGFDCNGCVDSGDIGSNQVNALEISAGAVGTSEIEDGSITADDLSSDAIIPYINTKALGSAIGGFGSAFVKCDDGDIAISGGVEVLDGTGTDGPFIAESYPSEDENNVPDGWVISISNLAGSPSFSPVIYVVCLDSADPAHIP